MYENVKNYIIMRYKYPAIKNFHQTFGTIRL